MLKMTEIRRHIREKSFNACKISKNLKLMIFFWDDSDFVLIWKLFAKLWVKYVSSHH